MRRYNRYQDVEIDASRLSVGDAQSFLADVLKEETSWIGRLGVRVGDPSARGSALFWLRIPVNMIKYIPFLVDGGAFRLHHATQEHVMLVKGVGNVMPENIPAYGTHYSRVECLVCDWNTQMCLVVRERVGNSECGRKLVTGSVEQGEHPSEAAIREVMEETGVSATFVGIIGVVTRTGTRFGKDEVLIGCVMVADSTIEHPVPASSEIRTAGWVPIQSVVVGNCGEMAQRWMRMCCTYPSLQERIVPDFRGHGHLMRVYGAPTGQ